MAQQVQLRLDVTPFVRRGEIVIVKAKAKRARWRGQRRFFFACDGGAVHLSGIDGPRTSIETSDLPPGLYIVKAHFEQGPSPLDRADAWASFIVNE
jgi:hypothetical protein